MFSVQELLTKLSPLTCNACRKFRGGKVHILSSTVEPVNYYGQVRIKINYHCPLCDEINYVQNSIAIEQFIDVVRISLKTMICRTKYASSLEVIVEPQVKPSIRSDAPSNLITEAEIIRAKRLLKRTSFRRTTASWKSFLDRLE